MQIIGQKHNLEMINSWKKMPQFTIIQGDKHSGKTFLTIQLCKKFGLQYTLMGNSVNNVRELVDKMVPNSNTIYHFKDFDTASIQAKNALLKITEEPIEGNYIVISGNTQIRTLESRARKLVMEAYSFEDVEDYLHKYYGEDKNLIQDIYRVGVNTPTKIKQYSKYEGLVGLAKYANEKFEKLTNITMNDFVPILNSFTAKYDDIDGVELFLNMLIHRIEYNILNTTYYDYYDILELLISAKESLEKSKSLNRKFVLYKVLYILYCWGGKKV